MLEKVIERVKQIKWTRERIELIALVATVMIGLVVFTVPIKTQKTITYDGGKLSYTGSVVNHRLNGQGKLTYDNGDVYEGGFDNGVFTGKGTFTSHQGWTYEGSFQNGLADGQGKLTTKAKKVYEGTFKQGIYQK